MVDVHLKGVFFLTQKLLPLMNDGGRIMNISSALTRFTIPGNSVYAPAKGAIEGLTHYLAKELAPRRIAAHAPAVCEPSAPDIRKADNQPESDWQVQKG